MKRSFQSLIMVAFHSAAMLRVLSRKKNRSKGTWRGMPVEAGLENAGVELFEFCNELSAYDEGLSTLADVEAEAADVSAYIAMVVDNLRADERRKRFPGPGPLWRVEK